MLFSDFCAHLSRIEATTLRLEITRELADLFRGLEEQEIEPSSWLLLGRLSPKYDSLEFNFAEKMMMRVLAGFVDKNRVLQQRSRDGGKQTAQQANLRADLVDGQKDVFSNSIVPAEDGALSHVLGMYKRLGDLGDVAEALMPEVQDKRTVAQVYSALLEVAKQGGQGSQERKLRSMTSVLRQSSPTTAKYVVRIALSILRLGFSDMTILDALSWAKAGDKSLRKKLELAYQMKADIGKLAHVFLTQGESGLDSFDIELGVPIAPALCQRLKTADEMIEKMGKVIVEPKYDGTRVLIHIKKRVGDNERSTDIGKHEDAWQIRTFTRNLEESSGMFPEIKSALDSIKANEVILDSEAVGYDSELDKLMPFQQTIQRKRKHLIEETASQVPLRFFVFDILYRDGKNLLHIPLHERKAILKEVVEEGSVFIISPYIVTDDPKLLREFHAKQLVGGLEGAVIKQYASEYQPGRRGWSWVKFKEEEGASGKLTDTIDCVVMGYYKGQGKRTKFGIGAFLVGVRDEVSDTIRTVAKIGTGLSDEQWQELRQRCDNTAVIQMPSTYLVNDQLIPDVWVSPSIVVEVAADEITNSPVHSAEKALRFPRLERFRDDKTVDQATTLKELRSIQ